MNDFEKISWRYGVLIGFTAVQWQESWTHSDTFIWALNYGFEFANIDWSLFIFWGGVRPKCKHPQTMQQIAEFSLILLILTMANCICLYRKVCLKSTHFDRVKFLHPSVCYNSCSYFINSAKFRHCNACQELDSLIIVENDRPILQSVNV